MMSKGILFVFVLLCFGFVSAFDFSVNIGDTVPSSVPYEGDKITFSASVTPSVAYGCKLICKWETEDFGENEINNGESIGDGNTFYFDYFVTASGDHGEKDFVLYVSCMRSNEGLNCFEEEYSAKSYPSSGGTYNFEFDYNGDGDCQVKSGEDCIDAKFDCTCSSGKSCINEDGDSSRNVDEMKCSTYCGNGVVENKYEDCTNCAKDVGYCDGYSGCSLGSECEGGYCVHSVCWNSAWKEGDVNCDLDIGENCKNSVDCSCGINELCSNSGVCEKSEEFVKHEISEAVQSGVQENLTASKNKEKVITFVAIGLIFAIFVTYFFYKFISERKNSKKKTKKGKKK